MKLLNLTAVCAIATLVFSSCGHKDDGGGGSPVNNSYLRSVYTSAQGTALIDSLHYDDQKRVASYGQYITTAGNSAYASFDFHYSGANTLPDSYVYDDNGYSQQTHQLSFDGQGRIVKDTSADSHFATHYIYSGDYIIMTILGDGTMDDATVDTLLVKDGNIAAEKIWQADNGTWEKQGDVQYSHATAANPGYKSEIAGSIGPLLYVLSIYTYGGWGDYISKAAINKVFGDGDGLPPGGFNYSVKVDGSGRVNKLVPSAVGMPAGYELDFNYY